MVRHVEHLPRARVPRSHESRKVPLDQFLDLRTVEVADGDDSHQIGTVPIGIEPLEHRVVERLQRFFLADGETIGVP